MKKKAMMLVVMLGLMCACGSPQTEKGGSEPEQSLEHDAEAEPDAAKEEPEQEEKEKEEPQEDTEALVQEELKKAEEFYAKLDFKQVEACYDKLDELEYDTAWIRKVLEYDQNNYEDAKGCYEVLKDAKEKLDSGSYMPLSGVVDNLRDVAAKIDGFPVNTDSKAGKYISDIKNNNNFMMLKLQILDSQDIDFDSGFTASAYAQLIGRYLSSFVTEPFPYSDGWAENGDSDAASQGSEYTLDDVLAELRLQAGEVGNKTDCVHVDPSFIPMSGEPYYCLETTDAYVENTSLSGKPCKLHCKFLQSQSKKFCDYYFSLDFEEELGFDILRVKVSDGKSEVEIGQQYIENGFNSLYILTFNSTNSDVEDNKERAEQLHEMAAGSGEITFVIQGAEQEDSVILTQEQKDSVLYITEIWSEILNYY